MRTILSSVESHFLKLYESSGINLNTSQMEAVKHHEGPLLVQAGPGSGKSTVLAAKIQYLLTIKNVRPHRIMAITFTRKAARELKDRVRKLPQINSHEVNSLILGTFHSVFLRILRGAGLKHEILASDSQKESIINSILKKQGLKDQYCPENLLAELSYLKNYGYITEEMEAVTQQEKEWLSIMHTYEEFKDEHKLMDFDDILLETKRLLGRDDYLLSGLQGQFEYILIDEFQDINRVQLEVMKMISAPGNNICAVGDMQQSIFGWRGASIKYITEFVEHFPGPKIINLNINYRSTRKIIGLANRVISHNKHHLQSENNALREGEHGPVTLSPENLEKEAELIVQQITKKHHENGIPLSNFAVLYRTVESSRAIFEKLAIEDVPFICYNNRTPFYETDCIKPLINYLRLALDSLNLKALLGVMHTLYLSRKKWAKLLQGMHEFDPTQPVLNHLLNIPELQDYQRESIQGKIKLICSLNQFTPTEAIRKLRQQFYDRYISRSFQYPLSNQKEQIFEKLDELETSASRFNSLHDFIEFINLVLKKHKEMQNKGTDESKQDDKVSLMTIHTAKGLEFHTVFIIGAVEDVLPHKNASDGSDSRCWSRLLAMEEFAEDPLDEECRLLFVAITRAIDELYISCPKYYKKSPAVPSRFLINLERGDATGL